MTEGASQKELLTKAKEVYPDNHNLQLGLDMAQHINPDVFNIALTAITIKGKIARANQST